ncbi:MAG TPA: L-threonylcarbamoyladenylate synthase [Verrucomicrobiales bacterium]|nr:L-threonylcarbamoyladenylate synthase [Verrucomicrobiales bacterium]
MKTEVLATDPRNVLRQSVLAAVEALRRGEIVALPTETVYGLAADAANEAAVAAIFEAKERPRFDPLIVHLARREDLERVACLPEEVAAECRKLVQAFWPGPLTLVLPKTGAVGDLITAGLCTVAVRMSAHRVFRQVVEDFGSPLAAPSANRFGRISPTSAAAVLEELEGRIPLLLDGGACPEGLESTIVRVAPALKRGKPEIRILRAGPVTPEDLKPFGKVVLCQRESRAEPGAPGQLPGHYAPRTPLRLLEIPEDFTPVPGRRYALLSLRGAPEDGYVGLADFEVVVALSPGSGKLREAAVRFFHVLRHLDAAGVDEILAEPIPERGLGVAIMERLRRAAAATRGPEWGSTIEKPEGGLSQG